MNMTNILIARAIAEAALKDREGAWGIEDVDPSKGHGPAYYGVVIYNDDRANRTLHLYLCDDDAGSEIWMLDPSDAATGEVNPQVLTAANLEAALAWFDEPASDFGDEE